MALDKQNEEDGNFDLSFHAETSSRFEVKFQGDNNTVLVHPPGASAWAYAAAFTAIIGVCLYLWHSGAFGQVGQAGLTVTTPVPIVVASPLSDKGNLLMKRRPSGKTKIRRPSSQITPAAPSASLPPCSASAPRSPTDPLAPTCSPSSRSSPPPPASTTNATPGNTLASPTESGP